MSGRVVVTGGSGRIGRHVVAELLEDYDVLNVDLADGPLGQFQHCDVLDRDAVASAVAGAWAVCHLAGLDYDTRAGDEAFFRVNTLGTWNVLEACARAGVEKVVVASSVSAYGLLDGAEEWVPQFLPVDESHPYRPHEGYSLSKLVTEEIAKKWSRSHGLTVACLQPLHVVGTHNLEEFDRFLAEASSSWLHNYVAVTDVARAFKHAVDAPLPCFATFIVGADDSPRAEPTLDWVERALGHLPQLRNPRLFEQAPRASVFSTAKARELLGWTPRTTLADIRQQ